MTRFVDCGHWRSVLPVLAMLLAQAVPGQARPVCLEFDGLLVPDTPLELTIEGGSWIDLIVRYDRAYRISVEAVAGCGLEVWSTYFDEGQQCSVLEDQLTSVDLDQPTGGIEWTNRFFSALRISLPDGVGPTAVVLNLEELAAPPEEGVLVVPAVAHTVGARGELFQSDLVLFNPVPHAVPVALVLVPTGGGAKQRIDIEVGASEMIELEDVVAGVFGLTDAVGALRIEYPSHRAIKGISRTYAITEVGTYGQFVPAVPFFDAASRGIGGAIRLLPHLVKSVDFRSNVGFVEVLGLEAVLNLRMIDQTGATLASEVVAMPPLSHRQINDVFAFLGVDGGENAALRIELESQGRVLAYASVVDNHSSDPVFVPGLVAGSPYPDINDHGSRLVVPAAASNRGAHGTRWRTDLRVLPMPDQQGALEVIFRPNDGAPTTSSSFFFDGAGPLAIDDVVATIGATGAGHLRLSTSSGGIAATSRTYTAAAGGTYGQFIPAEWLFVNLDRGVLLGLKRTDDFRTNIGLVNPAAAPVEVELRLVAAGGEVLGSRAETLAPGEGWQINDVFLSFGLGGCDLCRLEFEDANGSGGPHLYVWGSVVDNRTGDAIFIPPIPF